MSDATLILDAVIATATALLYAFVGTITLRRATSDAMGRRAVRLFAIWWYGLATITIAAAARNVLAAADNLDVGLHTLLANAAILPLVVALWGLVSYLAYIYTGSPRVFAPITILHVAILIYLVYLIAPLEARSVEVGTWSVTIDYGVEFSGTVVAVLLFSILAPAIIAALGYATLYFRTDDRIARYRIGMVSGAFLLWFGSAALAAPLQLSTLSWWPLVSRAIGLVATLMVLAAYRPPGWLRERYGLRSVEESTPPSERTLRLAPTFGIGSAAA